MKLFNSFFLITLLLCCKNISGQETRSYKDLWKEGKKKFEAADYTGADSSLARAISLKPDDFDANVMDGKALLSLKKYSDAAARFTEAVKAEPKEKETYLLLADCYKSLNDYQKAETTYNDILKLKDSYLDAYLGRALVRLTLKKFADAAFDAQKAIDIQSNSIPANYYLALAYDSLKNYQEARQSLEKTVFLILTFDPTKKIEPVNQPPYVDLGNVYNALEMPDKAIAIFNESMQKIDPQDKSEPKNSAVYFYRAKSYSKKGEFSNSISDLNKSIAENNNFYNAFKMRADLYFKTSQYQSAISDYSKAISLNEKEFSLYRDRAKCEFELGQFEQALSDYKTAYSLKPEQSDLKNNIAIATQKVFETNREAQPPQIKLASPVVDSQGFINLLLDQEETGLTGEVLDQSLIKSISVNGNMASFKNDLKNPEFSFRLNNSETDKIEIKATDVYDNTTTKEYKVGKILSEAKLRYDLSGKILSADGQTMPISNLNVFLFNKKGEKVSSSKTDEKGFFVFKTLPYDRSELTLILDSMDTRLSLISKIIIAGKDDKIISTIEKGKGQTFSYSILPFASSSLSLMTLEDAPLNIDFKGRLMNGEDMKSAIAYYTILLLNGKGEVIDSKKTDAFGYFLFSRIKNSDGYSMKLDPTEAARLTTNKIVLTDEKGRIIKEFSKNDLGQFEFKILPADETFLSAITEEDPYMRVFNLNENRKELDIIENIYYQSGAWDVDKDAEVILQKLANVLNANPKVNLEVQSHTDAPAGDDFNMELSQKRATAVTDYLVKGGVDKKRLAAIGFGETKLINRCGNGIDCSDAEHKQNRRTVFVLKYVN